MYSGFDKIQSNRKNVSAQIFSGTNVSTYNITKAPVGEKYLMQE